MVQFFFLSEEQNKTFIPLLDEKSNFHAYTDILWVNFLIRHLKKMLLLTINANHFMYLELNPYVWRLWPAFFNVWFLLDGSWGQRPAHKRSLEHYHWTRPMFISLPMENQKTILTNPSTIMRQIWEQICHLKPKSLWSSSSAKSAELPCGRLHCPGRSDGHCLLLPAV